MPFRLTFALAMLSALTGCVAAPPTGPFVEHRAGLTPTTRPVECPGTYALYVRDQPLATGPLFTQDVLVGERIGFRREPDGSVSAVGPILSQPLPPGTYSWEIVPSSVPSRRERQREEICTRTEKAAKTTRDVLAVIGLVTVVVGLLAWAYVGSDRSQHGR